MIGRRNVKRLLYTTTFTLAILFAFASVISLQAQQPTYLNPIELDGQRLQGSYGVAQYGSDGSIALTAKGTEAGIEVVSVMAGGPAAIAGLLPGDIIVSMDGASAKGLGTIEGLRPIAKKKDGEAIDLVINRGGQLKTVRVTVGARGRLYANDPAWQKESTSPPTVIQPIFGGRAALGVGMFQNEQYFPHHAFIFVNIYNHDADPFIADDIKFFVLDGTGQQLRHAALDEIKYSIQLSVARNWKGGNYVVPPLPFRREYTISGVQTGYYTVTTSGGGAGAIAGTSSSRYTVTEKPDYVALGVSILSAVQQYRDANSNQKALEQANAAMATWEGTYYKSGSPIVSGERRGGDIMYWTGSNRRPEPPYRVIISLTNPRTQKEEYFAFAFGPGAERIKQDMMSRSKTQRSLSNGDVVGMIKAGIGAEVVIAEIKAARCSFETNPTALIELKNVGVPDSVILAMVEAPKD
jgi:membrane-associated protease RseP (regulator of RpoE activity)